VNHSSSTIQMQSVGEEEEQGGGEYESKSNNLLLSFTVKQKIGAKFNWTNCLTCVFAKRDILQ
jgi:hypothetical protein